MESKEPFGDEMPNFDICGTVFKELFKDIDVLDVDVKTETAASSENSARKNVRERTISFAFTNGVYLTIRPVARKGYGSIAHEAKPNGLLIRGP